jgi:hypothetical protein
MSVHASHKALNFTYSSLILAHPARDVGVLKRHGVGERAGELGVDFILLVRLRDHLSMESLHQIDSIEPVSLHSC